MYADLLLNTLMLHFCNRYTEIKCNLIKKKNKKNIFHYSCSLLMCRRCILSKNVSSHKNFRHVFACCAVKPANKMVQTMQKTGHIYSVVSVYPLF